MVSLRVWLHDQYCTALEELQLYRASRQITRAWDEAERYADQHRAALATERAQLVASMRPALPMARRLANLTYPIEEARQKALHRFETNKRAIMGQLLDLLRSGERYTLRQLGDLLNIAPNTARTYRLELSTAGLI